MTPTTDPRADLSPHDVLDALAKHILVDGYHVVMDFERSRGSNLYDARSGRPLLDIFTNFAIRALLEIEPFMDNLEGLDRHFACLGIESGPFPF